MRVRPSPSDRRLLVVLVLVSIVVSTIAGLGAPLLETIARVDHVTVGTAQWALTVTVLVGAVCCPVLGRLGDGPDRRMVILTVLAAVAAGSTLAALPGGGFALLLVGRSMQGLGLALSALIMATARDHLSEPRLPSAIALLAVSTTVGVGLSYPITSLLDDVAGVHAPFWFGTVVAGIALLLCWAVIPASEKRDRRPLDFGGAALIGTAVFALLLAVTEAHSWSWTSLRVILLLAASAALGYLWVLRERSAPQPLFDLKLLKDRTLALVFVTSMMFSVSVYLFVPLVSDFVQVPRSEGYGFGASVFVAGLMLVPFSALSGTVAPVATSLSRRFGPGRLLFGAGLVVASGSLMFAATEGALWQAFVALAIMGVGFGNSVAVMPGLIVASVPPEETGSALGFMSVTSFIGLAFGSGIGASILGAYTKTGQLLPERTGFTVALVVGAGGSIVAAIVATRIRPGPSSDRGSHFPQVAPSIEQADVQLPIAMGTETRAAANTGDP